MLNVEAPPASASRSPYTPHRMVDALPGSSPHEGKGARQMKEEDDQQALFDGSQIGKKLSSRYRGVCWNKKNRRWQAAINSSGKYLYLGSYVSEEEAARAFDRAAVRIRGRKARINFKFEDYADEDLESWHSDLHSKDPKDNRTKASKTPVPRKMPSGSMLSELGIPGVSVLSGVPNSDFGFGGGVVERAERRFHDGRIVGGASLISTPMEKQGSGLMFSDVQAGQGGNEQVWGPVVEVPQPGDHGQVVLAHAPKNEEAGAANLYIGNDQAGVSQTVLMELANQQPVLLLPNSQHSNQSAQPNAAGEASTPSGGFGSTFSAGAASGQGAGEHQLPSADANERTPLPPDSQILKIVPCNYGVFGVMYARPGHSGMGAAVWDGRAINDMGMFSTKADAERACTAGTEIVVRFHSSGMNPHVSNSSDGPYIIASLAENEGLAAAAREAAAKGQVQLVGDDMGENSQRDGPAAASGGDVQACVPGLNNSQQNLLRLLSIGSEDLNKYLTTVPSTSHDASLSGVIPEHNRSVTAIAEMIKQDNGNLGSLLHWDSWNSSILGLLSKSHSPSPGAPVEKHGGEDKEQAPQNKENGAALDAESSRPMSVAGTEATTFSATAIPSWLKDIGSLAELGSITFQGSGNLSSLVRANEDCYMLQQQGSGFGSEVGEAGVPEATPEASVAEVPHAAPPRSGSLEKHKDDNPFSSAWRHNVSNVSSDYDEVVDWFVSRPQRDENKKSKSDGPRIKSEEGTATTRDARQLAGHVSQPSVTRTSSLGDAAVEGLGLHGGTKRKGLEGCEDLITTKRPRSP
ncbi:unnamed protein product [Ostreobium quekettii]|uniref:AP2/ERF domain-containing protein n=1 Tax=Ostreobium quekettii TaxID=121088 RepID=A0A8S1JCB7_9CHLO|nr:unnamed protein product [Ostreobium quekettii]